MLLSIPRCCVNCEPFLCMRRNEFLQGLTFTAACAIRTIRRMHDLVYWIAGLVGLAFLIHGLTDWFSRDARVGRKRRRNHGQISYKSKHPMILLNVRTKKPPKK